ncbi:hypothetical protein EB73_33855 [Mycobacterium sp. SWH-M3]|nr:hypothetical protein EB73_33855 [Mycobacterium sp. SWH-M3]
MTNAYPVATICGTMKLFDNMLTVADELTRQGYLVLAPFTRKVGNSVSVQGRIAGLAQGDGKQYDLDGRHLNATPITGDELHQLHRTKIDMADRVVFVTDFSNYLVLDDEAATHETGFYFGHSTTGEFEYARSLGKTIEFARVERRDHRDTIIWLSPEGDSGLPSRRVAS